MKRLAIALLALALTACASAPKYKQPVTGIDPPPQWTTEVDEARRRVSSGGPSSTTRASTH